MQEDQAEVFDEGPAFVRPDEAVEVSVDDAADVPMEDNDDDDEEANAAIDNEQQEPVTDMSQVQLTAHMGPVFCVDALYDEATQTLAILSGGGDDQGVLHHVPAGQASQSHVLPAPRHDSVASVVLFRNDTTALAALGDYEGHVDIFDLKTNQLVCRLEGPTDVEWVAFHPTGTVVLAGSAADGTVWMYHLPTKQCLQVLVGHESAVNAGAFSPDGKIALSASADGTLRVWAPKTGVCRHAFRLGGAGLVCLGTGGGSDVKLIACGAEDGYAYVCHYGNKKVVATLRHYEPPVSKSDDEEQELPMSVEAVAFSTFNTNWCATGGADGCIRVWDLANQASCRQVCRVPAGQQEGLTRIQWHPTLPLLFGATTQGRVYLWDARNGALLHTWTGHTNVVNDLSVCFAKENKSAIIVTAGEDKVVRVFEADLVAILKAAETTPSAAP